MGQALCVRNKNKKTLLHQNQKAGSMEQIIYNPKS